MCGIVGVLSFQSSRFTISESLLTAMRDTMTHRGPDDSGVWESADGKTAVSAIVARICEEFDVDPERAERDTMAFIAKLRERGLLTVSETLQAT